MTRYSDMTELVKAYHYGHSEDGQISTGNMYFQGAVLYSYGEHFPIAVRLPGGGYLMNGDRYSATTDKHQARARSGLGPQPTLPFTMLCIAFKKSMHGLVKSILQGDIYPRDTEAETYVFAGYDDKGMPRHRHVLGGVLFSYEGNRYLATLDPSGVGIGLYFITQLADPTVDSIDEAYESLKPDPVKQAESKGLEIRRQGEYFFVPAEIDIPPHAVVKHRVIESQMPDRTNHHKVTEWAQVGDQVYARGTVRHTEGEHRMLRLYEDDSPRVRPWHAVYENVQVQSWSADGSRLD